ISSPPTSRRRISLASASHSYRSNRRGPSNATPQTTPPTNKTKSKSTTMHIYSNKNITKNTSQQHTYKHK
ncbi:hypothetical protein, partial [Klebsiella pneumoniae]|uniref:hypothetical protein n=1 Tax=Klebsiella pneumoniae TaxID=573 RepID=UPI002730041B